jgi:hypothetical protein
MAEKRFQKVKNGVRDTRTNLIWEKTQNGNKMTWDEAMEYATSLGINWRLPSIGELLAIIDYSEHGPASNLPEIIADNFWSSTTNAYVNYYAWYVNFYSGDVSNVDKDYANYVRCVRIA